MRLLRKTSKVFILTALLCVPVQLCCALSREEYLSYPSKVLANYEFNEETPLIKRVSDAPAFLLKALKEMDQRDDYTVYTPSRSERKIIGEYLEMLPEPLKREMKKRLIGIYFIDNLLGSGLADFVFDKDRNIYMYLCFNPKVLKPGASEWATAKENSCFINDDPAYGVRVKCGAGYKGFLYILFHESAHIWDYSRRTTPFAEPQIQWLYGIKDRETPFTAGIWKEYSIPSGKYNYSSRKNVTFYGMDKGPKLNISQASSVYRELAGTPFVSLYGSLNWADDFADLFMYYCLAKKYKQPYALECLKNGEVVETFRPLENPLVRARMGLIERVFYPK